MTDGDRLAYNPEVEVQIVPPQPDNIRPEACASGLIVGYFHVVAGAAAASIRADVQAAAILAQRDQRYG